MRRLIALLVVAGVGAGIYGVSGASSGLRVGSTGVSAATMRAELTVIGDHRTAECYLTALARQQFSPGSGGGTVSASGAAAWTGLRVQGLVIEQYVDAAFHFHPTASMLAAAQASLESDMSQALAAVSAAAHTQYSCGGSPATALADLTPAMRASLVGSQAASLELESHIKGTIRTTTAGLEQYYLAHPTQYDTVCVSAAVVEPSNVSAFVAMEKTGASISALVAKYSIDVQSAAVHGALGCYAPSNSVYANVRADLVNTTPGKFSASPIQITYGASGGVAALFLTTTKITATPFASAEPRVLADVTSIDTTATNSAKESILYHAHVSVDPSLGRWGLSTSGPGVFAPGTPAKSDVPGASILAGTSGATYR
ncbi:MAG TPA: hypothetical protein VGS61_05605 [Acidimicrobiales bacterium]|nr:hypothetical protein [Acidimicrobiales bacterium]